MRGQNEGVEKGQQRTGKKNKTGQGRPSPEREDLEVGGGALARLGPLVHLDRQVGALGVPGHNDPSHTEQVLGTNLHLVGRPACGITGGVVGGKECQQAPGARLRSAPRRPAQSSGAAAGGEVIAPAKLCASSLTLPPWLPPGQWPASSRAARPDVDGYSLYPTPVGWCMPSGCQAGRLNRL